LTNNSTSNANVTVVAARRAFGYICKIKTSKQVLATFYEGSTCAMLFDIFIRVPNENRIFVHAGGIIPILLLASELVIIPKSFRRSNE
jgi:hypothetical protein